MSDKKIMKYEYLLYTWGGFYNDEYQKEHNEKPGYHYFTTKEERSDYLKKLYSIQKKLGNMMLAVKEIEGYNTKIITILHRVTKYKNKEYHTILETIPGFSYDNAKYTMENKWYPGGNDYPLGKDFDYENGDYQIVQEWIEGAFDISDI